MRHLIVNADDFGLCESVNRGILDAAQQGLVTSVSLMGNGRAFDDAVARLRGGPTLDVGVHLVLVEERPLGSPRRLRSLVDGDGRLPRTWAGLLGRLAVGRRAAQEAERECRAQIERVLAAGLRPSHLDSHQHVHCVSPLWRMVVRLANEYRIPWVRGFRGAWRPVGLHRWHWWKETVCRWPLVVGASALAWHNRRHDGKGIRNAATWGIVESGHLTERVLDQLLRRLPEGVTELICHPGYACEALRRDYAHWAYEWPEEVRALTVGRWRNLLKEHEVQLTTFQALSHETHEAGPSVVGRGEALEACPT